MELWKPPTPRLSLIGKIGKHFRSFMVSRDPFVLARRSAICGMCHTETEPGSRHWSNHFRRFVHLECIPSIVRRAGRAAVVDWLDSGEFHRGPLSHRELVSWQTQAGN